VLLDHRKETAAEPARENFNTGRDPAIGWTSPLPAVRMRAAMLVSAVVATCRGRRRRGAIREDVCWLLTSRTDGVGFRTLSTRLSQIGTSSNAAARKYNNAMRFGFGCRLDERRTYCHALQLSVRGRDGSRTECCPGLRISNRGSLGEQSMQQ